MIHRFEDCELDTVAFELRRAGAPVEVQPQVFELLRYLIEHRDRMVSKDEIFSAVWPDRIVSDAALSSQIKAGPPGHWRRRQCAAPDPNGARTGIPLRRRRDAVADRPKDTAGVERKPDDAVIDSQPNAVPGTSHTPSVAVLPFANTSGDPAQEYFSDGVTDDITAALSKFRWLTVAARYSARMYRERQPGPREIAAELGVHYLVQGSVRRGSDRLRINCELIDARSGTTAWAEHYDGEPTDVFDVQDEIISSIVGALGQEIDGAERDKARRATGGNLDAWELYQRGMWHIGRYTYAEAMVARDYLLHAVALDPALGNAHAALALLRVVEVFNDWSEDDPDALLAEAFEHAQAALLADDQDTFAHYAMGRVLTQRGQLEAAVIEFQRALEHNRNHALTHFGLGSTLHWMGDHERALPYFDKAAQLSPNHPVRWAFDVGKGMALSCLGRHAEALELVQRSRRHANIDTWPHCCTAAALVKADRLAEARQVIAEMLATRPTFTLANVRKSAGFIEPGQFGDFLEQLKLAGLPE